MKNSLKSILFYLVLIVGLIIFVSYIFSLGSSEQADYGQILTMLEEEKVTGVSLDKKDVLTLTDADGKTVSYQLRDYQTYLERFADTVETQYEKGIIKKLDIEPYSQVPWWVAYLPMLIVVVIFVIVWIVMMNQANGKGGKIASFGKARVRMAGDKEKKVYFTDVAGADEEKEELREVVNFLRDPQKFVKLGARIPRGVRDLFETARKSPASIIFIDEIDAVGRHRGAGLGGGHDEREQTLNQLLVEMDGFGTHEGIIVMAATNRPDILDPALLRPGRFDRQITVHAPDIRGREEILKVHAKNKPLASDVDLSVVARTTAGFTGADLANLLNEAALLAARKDKSLIGMDDIEQAFSKITMGPQKKSMHIKDDEKRKTAYHEAGHALIGYLLPGNDPVHEISIIPSGKALGVTLSIPEEDKYSVYRNELKDRICMLLGGRAAEELTFDDISGGASNDMERATKIANRMITRLGMSEKLGPVVWGSDRDEVFLGYEINSSNGYSEKIAAEIDTEIRQIIEDAYARAKQILSDNAEKLHFVAEYLVKYEVMTGDQFKAYLERGATEEELNAMVEQKRRKQAEEDAARKEAEEKRRAADELARRRREEREHAMRGGFPRAPQPPSDTQQNADESEDGTNGE